MSLSLRLFSKQLRPVLALAITLTTVATIDMRAQSSDAKASAKDTYAITFSTTPDPPKTGDAALTVTVKGPDGKAVTDADVSATFFMAAMPAMKMPEMKNTVTLKHDAADKYVGKGQVMMAGTWEVTVAVKRGGKEVPNKKFKLTAQS